MSEQAAIAQGLADELAERGLSGPRVAVVLGSGLGGFAERLANRREVAFDEVTAMPAARVPGHSGRWCAGELGGVEVLVQQGRIHLYEGHTAEEVARPVRAFGALGCRALVLTNAAGGLRRELAPPALMRIEDHVNMQGVTPLARTEIAIGTPYDAELGALVERIAQRAGVELARGVYAGLPGPSYETPAEIALLARLGVHAVGMSTVCEASAASASGLRVVGISCISNLAAGISPTPLDHGEVVAAGDRIAPRLEKLLAIVLPEIVRACS